MTILVEINNGQPTPLMWYTFILLFFRILALENYCHIDDWTQASSCRHVGKNIKYTVALFSALGVSVRKKNNTCDLQDFLCILHETE